MDANADSWVRCTADLPIIKSIMPLAIIEPEGLNPFGNDEWEEIDVQWTAAQLRT